MTIERRSPHQLVGLAAVLYASLVAAFSSSSNLKPRRHEHQRRHQARSGFSTRPTCSTASPCYHHHQQQQCWSLHATADETDTETQALSDVDARVLRSILEEEKLDLKTEDSVKQLLERGTRPVERPKKRSERGEEKYASKVLNVSLWKGRGEM